MGGKLEGLIIYFLNTGSMEAKKALFNHIWRRYYRRLRLFAEGFCRNRSAENAVQSVMLKVYRNLDKYNPAWAFSTWIFTIAHNTCLDLLRQSRPEALGLAEDGPAAAGGGPEEALLEGSLRLVVRNFIRGLPAAESQIAFLRFYENMKIREISRITGLPEGTVKHKIFTIRRDLRARLEEEEYAY